MNYNIISIGITLFKNDKYMYVINLIKTKTTIHCNSRLVSKNNSDG